MATDLLYPMQAEFNTATLEHTPAHVHVVPNGYGYLKYAGSLSSAFNRRGIRTSTPLLRGQPGREGVLSLRSGVQDLSAYLGRIDTTQPHVLVAHCSSVLLLSQIQSKELWAKVSKLVVYSYLANPAAHLVRFSNRAKEFGVRTSVTGAMLARVDQLSSLERLPVEIFVVHPRTPLNRLRANQSELDRISALRNVHSVSQPAVGYEIEDMEQLIDVESIVDKEYMPILEA